MEPLPEHTPKQASYKEKAAIKWNVNDLLAWIKDKRPDLLDDEDCETLRKEKMSGEVFWRYAGNWEFFRKGYNLSTGTAGMLADLATELVEEEKRSKLLSFMSCTPRRQQANNLTGNRQQAEDVDMSDAADMKRELLSFIPRRQQANNLTGPRRAKDVFKAGIPYKSPRPLLGTSGLNWVFQPHPELYKALAPNVLDHYTKYKENQLDKTYVPIYFYLGGAGTGKSRHGSEFASSVQQAIALRTEHHLYHELAERLKTAFVFHASFENGTSLKAEEQREPWNAVGTRMLHQLLGGKIKDIRREYVATPDEIFELVAAAQNVDLYNDFTGILVVDGIQRAMTGDGDRMNKASGFYGFLNDIGDLGLMSRRSSETEGGILRRTPFIMTCVTATFLGPTRRFLADTHRKRVYLPLNRLKAPTWKSDNSKVLNDDPGTRLLVNDVGGHARAIETIADELAQYRSESQPNITELADAVMIKLKERYREVISATAYNFVPVVQCVLSRQPILLQRPIPGSDMLWEHITAPGLLWFEKNGEPSTSDSDYDTPGYLAAPYIWLWLLARSLLSENIEPLCQFLRQWEFNDYQQLLHLQTGQGHAGNVTWQNFETFCCYFRILRSLGFGNGEEVMFQRLHFGCKKLRDDEGTVVVNQYLRYAQTTHQYGTKATSAQDVVTKHTGTLDLGKQLHHVILNAPSAPAGDFFLSIRTRSTLYGDSESKIVREIGQCKFVKAKLNEEKYIEEREKAAGPDDFFMLYTTTETADDMTLPNRSGLVDSSSWMSYFGPFAGHAFIASQYVDPEDKEPK